MVFFLPSFPILTTSANPKPCGQPMPRFLKNIQIQFISLVRKGANQKTIIWKSGAGESPRSWQIDIAKTDDDKRLVFGIVYSPGEIDSQGDITDAAEIEKAAYAFLKTSRTGDGVDKYHTFTAESGAFVAESWLVRKGDPVFLDQPEGSWAVAIKIDDDDLWSAVKSGEIGGLSMGGRADVEQVEKSVDIDAIAQAIITNEITKKGQGSGFLAALKRIVTGETDMNEADVKKIAGDAVAEAVAKMAQPLTKEDMTAVVVEATKGIIQPLADRLETLEKQTPGSAQGGTEIEKNVDHAALAAQIVKAYKGE